MDVLPDDKDLLMLFNAHKIEKKFLNISILKGGKNNRVYQLNYKGKSYTLKYYFYNTLDNRNRLFTEYSFISYAWNQGIRFLPKPYFKDNGKRIAIFDFIEGRKLKQDEITLSHILKCIDFIFLLNKNNTCQKAKEIAIASEAFFSIIDHINCVDRRIDRLKRIDENSAFYQSVKKFINSKLSSKWKEIRTNCLTDAADSDLNIEEQISQEDRIISPSDFGFHNALISSNNIIKFIDFEYAGWDDPAKLVCDFFCQPEIPIPKKFFSFFVEKCMSIISNPDSFLKRVKMIYPIYQIKWCCIMLNDFLPTGNKRREFALINNQKNQLEKVEKYFNKLETCY